MSFQPDELKLLHEEEEVEIEAVAPSPGDAHRVSVWIVVSGEHAYVRSVNGTHGNWYRQLLAGGRGTLHAQDRRIPIHAVHVADPGVRTHVSEAFRRKYELYPQDVAWINDESVAATTLRLERHG